MNFCNSSLLNDSLQKNKMKPTNPNADTLIDLYKHHGYLISYSTVVPSHSFFDIGASPSIAPLTAKAKRTTRSIAEAGLGAVILYSDRTAVKRKNRKGGLTLYIYMLFFWTSRTALITHNSFFGAAFDEFAERLQPTGEGKGKGHEFRGKGHNWLITLRVSEVFHGAAKGKNMIVTYSNI